MKNLFVILIFTLLIASCGDAEVSFLQERAGLMYTPNSKVPFTGIYIEHWEGGTDKHKTEYQDGKEVGNITGWYSSGQISYALTFKYVDGQKIRHTERWYENGQMRELVETDDFGNYHGLMSEWYSNGQKMYEDNYSKGLRFGKGTRWFDNGQVELTANFVNGKLDGLLQKWDANGVILIYGIYKNGVPVE